MKEYNLTYKESDLGLYNLLKMAKLNNGYDIFLFKKCAANVKSLTNYVVAVRRGDVTVEFHQMFRSQNPFSMYLDMICCYV